MDATTDIQRKYCAIINNQILFKGYTIELDYGNPYNRAEFMFFPTEQGAQHDADYDGERYKYCGNCEWADSLEEAKDAIDEIIMCAMPYHDVELNGRTYSFPWIQDAVQFASLWNADMKTPIHNP